MEEWKNYINDHSDTKGLFDGISNEDQLLYWYFYTPKKDKKNIHIFFNLYFNQASFEIYLLGGVIQKVGLTHCINPIISEKKVIHETESFEIKAKAFDKGLWNKYELLVSQNVNYTKKEWEITNIKTTTYWGKSWNGKRLGIVEEKIEVPETEGGSNLYKVSCLECKGSGNFKNFSIPKAYLAAGLKGYELYSCNEQSGETACIKCGGIGEKHLDWFIKENQTQDSSKQYKRGSGELVVSMMNRVQKLNFDSK